MYVRWILAVLHLLALGIGLGAVWWRGRALRALRGRGEMSGEGIRSVLSADTLWGIAALMWISTGLVRAFSSLEKGSQYYLNNGMFWIKMTLLVIILLLEVWPMATFIGWRVRLGKGGPVDTRRVNALAAVSTVQTVLVVGMVMAATAMARGLPVLGF
jgi:putative membrane protein